MLIGSDNFPAVDSDTHVIEPEDLWTARLPKKWLDDAPRVRWDDATGKLMWFFAGQRIMPPLLPAHAGWHEYSPDHPASWEEADKASYDVAARVARMDEYGITMQVLYPNIAMFTSARLQEANNVGLQNALIRAYNDWQLEWCSYAPERFIPMISVPFWDIEATNAEIVRSHDLGCKGIVFTQDPTAFGLPALMDEHWDSTWALAQERQLPVNFHIGSGNFDRREKYTTAARSTKGRNAQTARTDVTNFLANARTISEVIYGGVCHRFPSLKFVSVESGVGYLGYVLELLDWQWYNSGLAAQNPKYLLPSEYFSRQIYATFLFERASARHAIEQLGSENLMWETDFPHPSSMSPGPCSLAVSPPEYVNSALGNLDRTDLENVMFRNAARVYQLDSLLTAT